MLIEDYQKQDNCTQKLFELYKDKCVVPWCRKKPIESGCILAPFVWKSIHQTGCSAYNSINTFQCCAYHRHAFDIGIIMPQSIRKWLHLMHPAGVHFPCDFLGQEIDTTTYEDIPDITNYTLKVKEVIVKAFKEDDGEIPWDFDIFNRLLEVFQGQEDYRFYFKNYSHDLQPNDFNRYLPGGKYLVCSAYPFHPRYTTKGFATIIKVKNNGLPTDRGFRLPKRS